MCIMLPGVPNAVDLSVGERVQEPQEKARDSTVRMLDKVLAGKLGICLSPDGLTECALELLDSRG
jgi:hypothetical protein